jgi:signal transduction histidine kinase
MMCTAIAPTCRGEDVGMEAMMEAIRDDRHGGETSVLTTLMRIARAIAGQLDCQSILTAFAAELSNLLSYDHVDIIILCSNRQDHYFFEAGMRTGWRDFFVQSLQQPIDRSPARSVLRGHVPYLLTDDAVNDPRFHFDGAMNRPIFESNLRSRIILPMLVQGQVIGSLNISSHVIGRYDQESVTIASYCADLLSPYIYALTRAEEARAAAEAEGIARETTERMRLGALHLTQGMENERKRIAMDLHDQTLGDLAHLARKAAKLRKRYGGADGDFALLETGITACLTELRRIVEDLKPGVLALFGFSAAVEGYLEGSVADLESPIETFFQDQSAECYEELDETTKTALYRIVQESINNAVRHSNSQRIAVWLGILDNHYEIEVRDYGIGTEKPNPAQPLGGVGHMQTRASLIGATLELRRTPGSSGTTVAIRLPRQRTAAPASGLGEV